ncbi:hypothetical protein [Streptomyces yangpuensis]
MSAESTVEEMFVRDPPHLPVLFEIDMTPHRKIDSNTEPLVCIPRGDHV